jgi:hypothetical protein
VKDDLALAYELAYDLAVRALEQQREAVESLRTRAGVLFAGAAVASSVLGRSAFARGPVGLQGWIALAAFSALGVTLVSILWPKPQWDSTPSPVRLIETRIENVQSPSLTSIHRDLTYQMTQAHAENQVTFERLSRHFQVAAALLGVLVLSLVAGLAGA